MITLTGRTTLHPIDVVRPDFSQRIATGELKIRDHVIIETTDWQTYEFDITSITAASIGGKQRSIPIDQIVSIQKRVLDTKKTLLLVLLVGGGVVFTVALVSVLKAAGTAALTALQCSSSAPARPLLRPPQLRFSYRPLLRVRPWH